ncbi:MAG: hypothetical protein KM312_12440 [Hydrogenibacillus schlegelii]|uniref:Undecaprenyl-diphosphatase n=1 Tax=Hydrogenibacillus schlegelii TaxID=1484 RepID=A0A947CZP2_HYDSH|nr:hypothetical protein [Hydrogenibacillus schlegelii]MBT9283422.1 hypothetical protein [Hydrogenibacillus schlegelii]
MPSCITELFPVSSVAHAVLIPSVFRLNIHEEADADHEIGRLTLGQSALIGLAQSLALSPGFSRSGMTMVAGLYAGLSFGAAARFAFLLATPIILGADIVEVPRFFKPECAGLLGPAVGGGIAAGAAAYGSVWALIR